jgi:pyruvate dehydrogenase E2 component (dihydrolipoamide acetyltransferase)
MLKEIKMPSAGQTTDQATIGTLNVKIGDTVKRGDILLEAETDKATLPVESFAEGIVIDILVEEGDVVDAGDVLCVVGKEEDKASYKRPEKAAAETEAAAEETASEEEDDEYQPIMKGSAAKPAPKAAEKAPEKPAEKPAPAKEAPAPFKWSGDVKAMPNAKKFARENNVDLSKVVPSNGSLIKRWDVEQYLKNLVDFDSYTSESMTRMRKAIGRSMLTSVSTIPQCQVSISVNMTGAMALKDNAKEIYGIKLSYNDIMAKAVAATAKEFKLICSRLEGEELKVFNHANIGIAVGLDGALVVPVTKGVDVLSLKDLAAKNKENITKARDGKLLPSDMGTGSCTISNMGMFDVDSFTSIINPPEACIFSVGSIVIKPVWDGTQFVARPMCNITATYDHRIMDGSYMAKALKKFKVFMENPSLLLLEQ